MTLFIKTLQSRPKQLPGRRKKGEAARPRPTVEGEVVKTLSLHTLNIAAAAIVDLWKQQKQQLINNHDHPRVGTYALYSSTMLKDTRDKAHREYQDRGLG